MPKTSAEWDEVYREPGFAFGTEVNDFLAEQVGSLPTGPVICLAEGEGRNAVFLAQKGYQTTAVDYSPVAIQKAEGLAQQRQVTIQTEIADLEAFDLGVARWSGIVSIFMQVPPDLRALVFSRVVRALRPGGVFVCEAYGVDQLEQDSGGPKQQSVLYELEQVKTELSGLDWLVAQTVRRELNQGRRNQGLSAVVQLVGVKPA